jgi:hypothetical protein
MEKKILFGIWFLLTGLSTAIVLLIRRKRLSNWGLTMTEEIHVMVGVFSSLSGLFLVYKLITEFDKLQPIVDDGGILSMFIGSLATIWFGFTEVATLIPKKKSSP